tara:strand:- start:12334 stop:12612 length:279 start_codon:yes stop_codon:yes gene_type:complete
MDISNKNSLKNLCDSLAEIGLSECPDRYEDLKLKGWVSVDDVSSITNRAVSTSRLTLKAAVKSGTWESMPAVVGGNRRLTVYRAKSRKGRKA